MLYGVPRMTKLSTALPHASRSHSMLASNPPAARTMARARICTVWPPRRTVTDRHRSSTKSRAVTSASYATCTPRARRGGVVAVHQRFAATQEEQVRA